MIEVDISNIWGQVSLPDLLGLEREVFDAHMALTDKAPGWMDLPGEETLRSILAEAEEIRETSDLLVAVGGDGLARGVIGLLGAGNGQLRLRFVEGNLSTHSRNLLLRQLEGRDVSVCILGDEQPWDCLAMRELTWLLARRYGTEEAQNRVHRDPCGFVTMAAAGVDLRELLEGMARAREELDLRSYDNPAWLYAASRCLMGRRGRNTELLLWAEPELDDFGSWWRQLSAGAGGFPVSLRLTEGLPGPDNLGNAFPVLLRFDPPEQRAVIGESVQDPGGLNFLAGRTLDQVEDAAWETALEEFVRGDVPAVCIRCQTVTAGTVGELIWFTRLAGGICGGMPEKMPGREGFADRMLRLLGMPAR